MKSLFKISGIFALSLFLGLPCFSRSFQYNGPSKKQSFFPIGWSKDGTLFAYGWFETTIMISNGSQIVVKIQDLTTDKVIFSKIKTWDEGNVGRGGSYYPKSAKEAWKYIAKSVNENLHSAGIKIQAGNFKTSRLGHMSIDDLHEKSKSIPVQIKGQIDININIIILKKGKSYHLQAVSDKLGQKKISSIKGFNAYKISPAGYIANPRGTRIGIVLQERPGGPYSDYYVVGCNLKVGFIKPETGP